MGSEEINASEESRSHVKELVAIGLIASVIGIALGLLIDWFPTQASTQAETVDTLWDVLIIFSRPGLRAGDGGRPVLRLALPHEARRGAHGRPADPRQHAARDHLDRDPGDHPRRALLLLLRRADRHRGGQGRTRSNVRVVGEQFTWTFYYKDAAGKDVASPQLYVPARPAGELHRPVARRDPRLLGAGLPDEDRRRARDRHAPAHHAEDQRRVPRRLRRAVRARARRHAPDRARRRARPSSTAGSGPRGGARPTAAAAADEETGGGAGAPDGKAIFTDDGCGGCHALADAGTTGGTGPDLDEALAGKDEAFIEESIVDPSAEVAEGFSDGLMPPNLRRLAAAGRARRAREVPCRGDEVMKGRR